MSIFYNNVKKGSVKKPTVFFLCIGFIIFSILPIAAGVPKWYANYEAALEAKDNGNWQLAAEKLSEAIKLKDKETSKTRAYGTIFVEYFPHRELGICYFQLGDMERARQELQYSLSQTYSSTAQEYLDRIKSGERPGPSSNIQSTPATINNPPSSSSSTSSMPSAKDTSKKEGQSVSLVGERMSIAVLPFDSKGIGRELGEIDLFDKLVAAFVNTKRFKVFERAELQRIIEEQKLGASGVIDASTAAQFGKGIGVDAVVVGSITQAGNSVSVDARLIDTETAAIITAKDAFSNSINLQSLSNMINEVANRIKSDLPLLNGYVIRVSGDRITIDLGHNQGLKKGIKCHVFREGAPLVHPVTGEVISRSIEEICEIQVTEVFDAYSEAVVTNTKNGEPLMRDRIITK